MAAITSLTKYSNVSEDNSFEGQGIKAQLRDYAATDALTFDPGCKEHHVAYDELTGAMTINATVTNLRQFDKVVFYFDADGTERIVTFGTNFLSSGTITIPIDKGAVAVGYFDGTAIRITSREIYA